jgi:hypothetical protein
LQVVGLLRQLGGDHDLLLGDHGLGVVALHGALASVQEAAVRVGHVRGGLGVGRLVAASGLDADAGLLATGPGRRSQLGDPLLVAALAFGRLSLQPGLGLPQPRQPPGRAGQLGRQLVATGGPMLAVLGLVDLGRLAEDLLDLALELVEGAVGLVGGVSRHFGAIQRDQAQADQPGGGAQPQGLD